MDVIPRLTTDMTDKAKESLEILVIQSADRHYPRDAAVVLCGSHPAASHLEAYPLLLKSIYADGGMTLNSSSSLAAIINLQLEPFQSLKERRIPRAFALAFISPIWSLTARGEALVADDDVRFEPLSWPGILELRTFDVLQHGPGKKLEAVLGCELVANLELLLAHNSSIATWIQPLLLTHTLRSKPGFDGPRLYSEKIALPPSAGSMMSAAGSRPRSIGGTTRTWRSPC